MRIAAYCRVSTDREDQLNSLDAQKRFFTEFTKNSGHSLVRLYADEGISGTKTKNRREFLRLMQDAEKGLFEMVVVKDISRFARNTVDLLQSTRRLKALGIEMSFLTADMSMLGNSEFVLTIFGALAQEESANTSKRVKFGKRLNAEKGRVPNLVYGYDKTPGDYFNLTVNRQEAEVVEQIYSWYLSQGHGAAKIAGLLNQRGLRTKRGCAWSQAAVCRILTNRLYTGKIVNGKQEVTDFLTGARAKKGQDDWLITDRPELRIIQPETYERAAALLACRGKAFQVERERQSNRHLFSTLIKCKECGRSFRRTVRTYKNTYVRWVCSGRNGQGVQACPNCVAVDEAELAAALQKHFIHILQSRRGLMQEITDGMLARCMPGGGAQRRQRELLRQRDKLQGVRQKYTELYADDLITRQELEHKLDGLRQEAAQIENELGLVGFELNRGEQLAQLVQKTFAGVESFAEIELLNNAQLREVIGKIEVDGAGNVDIYVGRAEGLGPEKTVPICNNRT